MRKWFTLIGLLLALSLALAGCGQKVTAEEIVAHVRDTAQSTKDAHATIVASVNAQGMDISATAEVWEKSPNKARAEVVDASRADLKGIVLVSDGEQAWLYNPAENTVMAGKMGELEIPLPEQLLSSMQDVVQRVLDASNAELVGEEQVAGHAAYKLTLTPKEGEQSQVFPGNGTATLWVDKERWIVLKATYDAGTLGQGTMEVRDYEINTGVSDDRFQFEVPQGAKVVDVATTKPVPLTLDEAKAQAGFPLLVPEYVPAGATLIEVMKQGTTIFLHYDHSPVVSFTVVEGNQVPDIPSLGQGQAVTAHAQAATAISEPESGNTLLYWTENGVTISIAGHISLEEATKVADSLK